VSVGDQIPMIVEGIRLDLARLELEVLEGGDMVSTFEL
jgi:hypothetical protein